ncbi:MAG: hypothetical protein II282_03425, partial [Alistipes sp.]|nr:hypothetical protein [Alistipes sp.]
LATIAVAAMMINNLFIFLSVFLPPSPYMALYKNKSVEPKTILLRRVVGYPEDKISNRPTPIPKGTTQE